MIYIIHINCRKIAHKHIADHLASELWRDAKEVYQHINYCVRVWDSVNIQTTSREISECESKRRDDVISDREGAPIAIGAPHRRRSLGPIRRARSLHPRRARLPIPALRMRPPARLPSLSPLLFRLGRPHVRGVGIPDVQSFKRKCLSYSNLQFASQFFKFWIQ